MATIRPTDVEHRERHHLAPGDRVADAAVKRVGPVLREPDDVGRRLAPGQPAAQPDIPVTATTAPSHDHHAGVEPPLEQVERERPRRDEKDENPDRPVVDAVVGLVAGADAAVVGELDGDLLHVGN